MFRAMLIRRLSRFRRAALFACAAAVMATASAAAGSEDLSLRCRWTNPNDGQPLDFSFRDNPLIIMSPGSSLEVTAEGPEADSILTLVKDGRPIRRDHAINFTAPDSPGSYYIPLVLSSGSHTREAELCVLVPFKAQIRKTGDGSDLSCDGSPIGNYRAPSRSGNAKVLENPDCYQPPELWMRITSHNETYSLVPGLTAGDLVVPSEDSGLKHTDLAPVYYPMWLAVKTVRDNLPRIGIPGSAMKLISVYRTPGHNRAVGSNAFGRHIFGDAFDFYIDLDGKGKAADLNRDGKLDRRDAYPVIALVETLQAEGRLPMGGVGIYNTVGGDHEVTMHVDLRGHRATWGYLYGAGGKRSEFSWLSKCFAELDRKDEEEAARRAAKEGRNYVPPRREPLGP